MTVSSWRLTRIAARKFLRGASGSRKVGDEICFWVFFWLGAALAAYLFYMMLWVLWVTTPGFR